MKLDIWYFARIKEALGCEQENFELPTGKSSVQELIDLLSQRGDKWRETLADPSLLVAVNQTVASRQSTLAEGDEVAFFPPVSGG